MTLTKIVKMCCILFVFFVPWPTFGAEEDGDCSDEGWCVAGDCENGWGMYIYSDGTQYAGQYKDGLPHGQGELTYPDGSKYGAKWKEGFPDADDPNDQDMMVHPDDR